MPTSGVPSSSVRCLRSQHWWYFPFKPLKSLEMQILWTELSHFSVGGIYQTLLGKRKGEMRKCSLIPFYSILCFPLYSLSSSPFHSSPFKGCLGCMAEMSGLGGICVTLSKLLTSILSKIILNHKVVIKVRQNYVSENICTIFVDSTQYTPAPLPED